MEVKPCQGQEIADIGDLVELAGRYAPRARGR